MTIFNGEIICKEKFKEISSLIFSLKIDSQVTPVQKNIKFHGTLYNTFNHHNLAKMSSV